MQESSRIKVSVRNSRIKAAIDAYEQEKGDGTLQELKGSLADLLLGEKV